MRFLVRPGRLTRIVVAFLTVYTSTPKASCAESPVQLHNWSGTYDPAAEGTIPFVLQGTASHLGKFRAYGEVDFLPGEIEGSLVGSGPVVFEAADGDLLVGVVTWEVAPPVDGAAVSRLHFSWRDSVELSNGTVVSNTGRFVDDRPPGLVVVAIIVFLIPLLLPAIQK